METVLVGTLGAEPQVITLATALLLDQGTLARVVAVHTDARFPPIADALPALRAAFAEAPAAPPLECVAVDVADTLTPADLDRFADTLFAVLAVCAHRTTAFPERCASLPSSSYATCAIVRV